MKFKSINNFTLDECKLFIEQNPNDDLVQDVVKQMEYLLQVKERNRRLQQENDKKLKQKIEQKKEHRIKEFNTEFDRYYATQQYEKAFAYCLKNIYDTDNKPNVIEKAYSVIPYLKNCILLPSSIPISYDSIIDKLIMNGYSKMKYDGNSLKWHKCKVLLKTHTKTSEIISKCRIYLLTRIISLPILIFATYILFGFTTFVIGRELLYCIILGGNSYNDYFTSGVFYLMFTIGILCSLLFLLWWVRIYIKMHKEPRMLLRHIANIIIDDVIKK